MFNLRYAFLREEDFDAIYDTFLKAFSDYQIKMKMTKEQFRAMNMRRGLDYGLSVGAFDKSGNMVGLALNGADLWNGKITAYDMGTGVVPEFRRKGVADGMFDFLLPALKKKGVKQYLLEVIRSNEGAFKLYKKKGFRETRQFECFVAETESVKKKKTAEGISMKNLQKPDWNLFESFWDWIPSWQNSTNSIKRSQSDAIILGAYNSGRCVGYGVVYPKSGDIPQFAVRKNFRRKGMGNLILQALAKEAHSERLAAVNIDNTSHATIDFLTCLGFRDFVGQHEMILEL